MFIRLILFLLVAFYQLEVSAVSRLLSASASGEQEVLRLELFFDGEIDANSIATQFTENTMLLTIPEAVHRKTLSSLASSVPYINEIKIASVKDKTVSLEVKFSNILAQQMKENVSIESLGKTLIIEVLPPMWSKALPIETQETLVTEIKQSKQPVAPQVESKSPQEKEIPLFEDKGEKSRDSSGSGKIIFMVFSVIILGGYLIWWLKGRSKMVNGPESLMKIKMVTQFHLGPKKTLAVVRVAGESLLLGITENQISLIKTLSLLDEDLPEVSTTNFVDALKTQVNSPGEQGPKKHELNEIDSYIDEEFSFGPAVKTSLTQKIPLLRKMI